jgi:hypothetical protein
MSQTGFDPVEQVQKVACLVWDTGSMSWVKMSQASAGGGVIATASIPDGNDVALGATTDAGVVTDAIGTVSGKLRGLIRFLVALWDSTGSLIVIDHAHNYIHRGLTYFLEDSNTIGSGGTQDYLIITPVSPPSIHMLINADGTAITSFSLYEGADRTGTALMTPYNNNRNSGNTTSATFYKGQSGGTTDGVRISFYSSGASQGNTRTPTSTSQNNERILKSNTKYIFRITSGTAGNLTNVQFDFYEYTAVSP